MSIEIVVEGNVQNNVEGKKVTADQLGYFTLKAWENGRFEKNGKRDHYLVRVNTNVFQATVAVEITEKGQHGCVKKLTVVGVMPYDEKVASAA